MDKEIVIIKEDGNSLEINVDDLSVEVLRSIESQVLENKGVTLFLKNDDMLIPGEEFKYDHDLKMLFILSLLKHFSWNSILKRILTYQRLDKFERAYGESVLLFDNNAFNKFYKDMIGAGLDPYATRKTDLRYVFEFINYCKYIDEKYKLNLKITSSTIKDIKSVPAKSDGIIGYKDFMNVLKQGIFPIDIRIGMLFLYKGVKFGDDGGELIDIRFEDFSIEDDAVYLEVRGDHARVIKFVSEEAIILRNLLDDQRLEIEKAIIRATGSSYFVDSAAVFYNIRTKKKIEKILSPVTASSYKKRYNKFLQELDESTPVKHLTRKIVRNNGFAWEACRRIKENETFYASIINTMYQFGEITDESRRLYLIDTTAINSSQYKKAKMKVMIFGKSYLTE